MGIDKVGRKLGKFGVRGEIENLNLSGLEPAINLLHVARDHQMFEHPDEEQEQIWSVLATATEMLEATKQAAERIQKLVSEDKTVDGIYESLETVARESIEFTAEQRDNLTNAVAGRFKLVDATIKALTDRVEALETGATG